MDFSLETPFIDDEEEEDFINIKPKRKSCTRILKWLIGATLFFVAIYFVYGALVQKSIIGYNSTTNWLRWCKKCAPNNDEIELHYLERFERFIKSYDREYENTAEALNRFRTYVRNMNSANQLNNANAALSAQFGENIFADWTDEEFSKILMSEDSLKGLRNVAKFIRPSDQKPLNKEEIPDHFDWRPFNVVTPVKSQFKCGSCWAFATVGTVESAYAIGNGELRSLSEQQLLDCDLNDNACDGGRVENALQYVYENGLMNEYDYPYVAHRQDSCYLHGQTARIKSAVFLHQDEASIIDWLLHFGPVNVVINTTADMKLYTGGVYTPNKWECENKIIGLHALNIVGYGTWNGTNEKYWIIKNSWGQAYGIENGYVYFARGINSCGIEDQPMGVIA